MQADPVAVPGIFGAVKSDAHRTDGAVSNGIVRAVFHGAAGNRTGVHPDHEHFIFRTDLRSV